MIAPKVTMFGGKGGVGKTTCAGATALRYTDLGHRTLLISTDPTPSLMHIFEVDPGQKPVKVSDNLHLVELGPDEIREMWDQKYGGEVYEVFSALVDIPYGEFVEFISSILPGLTDEFMVDFIKRLVGENTYEHIVWDTAPLGQTIGLLKMPAMMREHLKPAAKIYSKLKLGKRSKRSILDIIKGWEELSAENISFLKDEVDFNLVVIPEALAIRQLDGIQAEFKRSGFQINRLIINDVISAVDSDFLRSKRDQQQGYVEEIHGKNFGWKIIEVPLFPYEIKGVKRLQEIRKVLYPD